MKSLPYDNNPYGAPPRGVRVPRLFWSCLAILPLTIASSVHRLQPLTPNNPRPILEGMAVPSEVEKLLQRSCGDCHSDKTVWPWYSRVAPLSWMIEGDVSAGRRAMNLSHWTDYPAVERQAWLLEAVPLVQGGVMPLPRYTLIHRDAKLSKDEIRVLSEWTASKAK